MDGTNRGSQSTPLPFQPGYPQFRFPTPPVSQDTFQTSNAATQPKPTPWYMTVAKEAGKIALIIGASTVGGMVTLNPLGAITGGAIASGAISALEQYNSPKKKIDWGLTALDTVLGAIPGGAGGALFWAGGAILKKMGVNTAATFLRSGSSLVPMLRAGTTAGIDGGLFGLVGGTTHSAYEEYEQSGKVNWQTALKNGFNSIIVSAATGGGLGVLISLISKGLVRPASESHLSQKNNTPQKPASGGPGTSPVVPPPPQKPAPGGAGTPPPPPLPQKPAPGGAGTPPVVPQPQKPASGGSGKSPGNRVLTKLTTEELRKAALSHPEDFLCDLMKLTSEEQVQILSLAMEDGVTPASLLADKQPAEFIQFLQTLNEKPAEQLKILSLAMENGVTPASFLAQERPAEFIQFLQTLTANPEEKVKILSLADLNGGTPAIFLAYKQPAEFIQFLQTLKNPAEQVQILSLALKNGVTPAYLLAQEGPAEFIQFLQTLKNPAEQLKILSLANKVGITPARILTIHKPDEFRKFVNGMAITKKDKDKLLSQS